MSGAETHRRPGRRAYEPNEKDRRTVETLTGFGARQDEIARVLGICDVTLRKYFEPELEQGVLKANAAVAQSLFELATRDRNVAACIFWLKTRAGWRESPISIDLQQRSYVVRAPAAVENADEWLQQYAPSTIEHTP